MKVKVFMALVVLALLWGPAFLFVDVAVQDIPPITLVWARVSLAAVILYFVLKFQGQSLPRTGTTWKHGAVAGLLHNTAPYVLLSWGQQYIDSAVAAILIGTTPLFTMVLAHLFTTDDHFTFSKIAGIALGFVGLAILLGPALGSGIQLTTLGLLAAVLAAASYAGAIVYSKQTLHGLPPLVGPMIQLTTASVFLLPLSLFVEQPYLLPLPSWPALSSLLLLAGLSTALAFVIYYRTMEISNPTVLSMVTYLVPVVAAILGVAVLSEQLTWNAYLGFTLVMMGLMVVNRVWHSLRWRLQPEAAVGCN